MSGEVYVMTNIAMPGLVKVGRSINAALRAEQLSSATGVPCSFDVSYAQLADDEYGTELIAHDLLSNYRINGRREFFYTRVSNAIEAVQTAALMSAWNKASSDARQEFLARIDSPLMGKRWA